VLLVLVLNADAELLLEQYRLLAGRARWEARVGWIGDRLGVTCMCWRRRRSAEEMRLRTECANCNWLGLRCCLLRLLFSLSLLLLRILVVLLLKALLLLRILVVLLLKAFLLMMVLLMVLLLMNLLLLLMLVVLLLLLMLVVLLLLLLVSLMLKRLVSE
jgi:hypothetical protein